jgi:hypothetical protein
MMLAMASAGSGMAEPLQAPPLQQLRLVGRVVDETRRPVDRVEVIVNRREVRAVTDGAGMFTLAVSAADSTVGFRRIGYRPLLLTLQPLPSARDTILVELVRSPVELPEVIASASPTKPLRYAGTTKYDEVFLRQKVGLGTLISREAIEGRLGVATYELLQGIPGVRTWNGPPKRIRFARCQDPAEVTVFVDGVRQVPGPASASPADAAAAAVLGRPPSRGLSFDEEPLVEMLSRVNPSDIEMIEVFRGPSEIPGVFHWNGCAVIAIWTRWNK